MVIQHNIGSINSNRMLGQTGQVVAKSTEKLSSGYKINHAADDAAGLTISEKMRKQIRGLDRGEENVKDGISFCQVADGALSEVSDMLNRMKVLAIQSANGTNSDTDRMAIDHEIQKLKAESERIFETTSFNTKPIWEKHPMEREYIKNIDYYPATCTFPTPTYKLTNENIYTWPSDGFHLITVDADESAGTPEGLKFEWTDQKGNTYQSELIEWPSPETAGRTLTLSDYFTSAMLSNSAFTGVNATVTYATSSYATLDQIKETLTTVNISTIYNKSISAEVSGTSGVSATATISSDGIYYSNINLNGYADTDFATYNSMTNIGDDNSDSTNALTFTFNFVDRGGTSNRTVTTVPTSFTLSKTITNYDENDRVSKDDKTLGITYYHSVADSYFEDDGWWGYYARVVNNRFLGYTEARHSVSQNASSYTAASIYDVLIGNSSNTDLGGLLDDENGTNEAVTLRLNYKLQSGNTTYGTFTLSISGYESYGADYFLDKLRAITSADLYASSTGTNTTSTVSGSGSSNYISFSGSYSPSLENTDITAYEFMGYKDLDYNIHSGPDADLEVKLHLKYKCLTNYTLGITDMNVLTEGNATDAIDLVDTAAQVLSSQRSLFGAYQNRLEHTVNNLGNIIENTTSSESRIRDTDMAEEMVRNSTANILAQSGQMVLAQSNQTPQGVLSLLQG